MTRACNSLSAGTRMQTSEFRPEHRHPAEADLGYTYP